MDKTAYCIACAQRITLIDPRERIVTSKCGGDRRFLQGTCPVCGCKCGKILGV